MNNDKRLLICYPLRLQRDDFEQLKKVAKRRDLTGAQLIRRAIKREIDQHRHANEKLEVE